MADPDYLKARPFPTLSDLALELVRYAWAPGTALRCEELMLVRISPADAVAEWSVFVGPRRVESLALGEDADEVVALLEEVLREAGAKSSRRPGSDRQLRSVPA